ncbi:hypothetical protein [Frankia sp. AgB32]|uniref:hypothetical protein n=1 Tax=Frankia sp. AgB32 TaxID=631119 RepID=UPI00200CC597|nr:hypothetical protein [Frankia sp. AgB32]MCK9893498.1 hypothetical protein [Frankia sp. AgB32]
MYSYLFSSTVLDDPDLDVTAQELRILRESGTLAALNRVELSGEIADIGPAWFFAATAEVRAQDRLGGRDSTGGPRRVGGVAG